MWRTGTGPVPVAPIAPCAGQPCSPAAVYCSAVLQRAHSGHAPCDRSRAGSASVTEPADRPGQPFCMARLAALPGGADPPPVLSLKAARRCAAARTAAIIIQAWGGGGRRVAARARRPAGPTAAPQTVPDGPCLLRARHRVGHAAGSCSLHARSPTLGERAESTGERDWLPYLAGGRLGKLAMALQSCRCCCSTMRLEKAAKIIGIVFTVSMCHVGSGCVCKVAAALRS